MADRVAELAAAYLRQRGLDPRPGVVPDQILAGDMEFGLTNLRQVCALVPESDWPATVQRHFDNVLPGVETGPAADWAGARPNLRIRIYSVADVPPAESLVAWALAEGLLATLVYDLPNALFNVAPKFTEPWGQSRDGLWQAALENMSREKAPQVTAIGEATTPMVVIEGESYYTATNVLWLDRLTPVDATRGAVVAIPSRHLLILHPVNDLRVAATLNLMLSAAARMYDQGPGSISDHLYWWRPGRLTLIPSDRRQNSLTPPDEFVQLLNRLPPAP